MRDRSGRILLSTWRRLLVLTVCRAYNLAGLFEAISHYVETTGKATRECLRKTSSIVAKPKAS
jgi:hypothetical protein